MRGSPSPRMKSGIFRSFNFAIAPALLPESSSPSVMSRTARLPAAASKASSAMLTGSSRFVPPIGMTDGPSSSMYCSSVVLSEVSGQARKARPAKATMPNRSLPVFSTSSRNRYLACSSRDGATSVAHMLFDTSNRTRISRPNVWCGMIRLDRYGLAAAAISSSRTAASRMNRSLRFAGE